MTPAVYERYSARRRARVQEKIEAAGGLDDAEKARREKIGNANAGKVPWNKGRKHSPGAHIHDSIRLLTCQIKSHMRPSFHRAHFAVFLPKLPKRRRLLQCHVQLPHCNQSTVTDGRCALPRCAETIEKIRARTKAAMQDPATIDKLRKAAGKPHTEETKEMLRQKMLAWHADRRAEMDAMGGGAEGDEAPGEDRRPRLSREEYEARQAEIKAKSAETMKKRWQDPEYRCVHAR